MVKYRYKTKGQQPEGVIMKDLKELLNEREISLRQLSKEIGVSRQTLYNLANKKTNPSFLAVKKICAYFNVDYKDYI